MVEKSFKDFSPSAKKGIHKYTKLSSKAMKLYAEKYRMVRGKNPHNVNNKEDFYQFVHRARIR